MSISLKAFESPKMKRFLAACVNLTHLPKVVINVRDTFIQGMKLPPDPAVEIVPCFATRSNGARRCDTCTKCDLGNGPYGDRYCKKCLFYEHRFVGLGAFLSIPQLPLDITHYRRVKGKHLKHALFLQHNIRRCLLGLGLQVFFPEKNEWMTVRDSFVNRQRTVVVSRVCRGLAPAGLNKEMIYEIIARIVPENTPVNDIVRVISTIIDRYEARR